MYHLGAAVSQVDPAVFYWLDDSSNVMGVLDYHVDDFIWGGGVPKCSPQQSYNVKSSFPCWTERAQHLQQRLNE